MTNQGYLISRIEIKAEVDNALDTAIPETPTTDSINERVKTLDDNYTSTRANYLDNINNPDLQNIIRNVSETTGTFSFDETSSSEQDMVVISISARAIIGAIWIDMSNVTRDTTIKVYHKIDGTNFREFMLEQWTSTDSDGVLIDGFTAYRDVKITLTCDGGGAGSVSVAYAIV